MKWRVLLGVLLVYVALDLSLPAMPGAFMFEAGDSVEGTHGGRNRLVTGHAIAPALPGQAPIQSEPRVDLPRRLTPLSRAVWHARAGGPSLPRGVRTRSPLSEDHH